MLTYSITVTVGSQGCSFQKCSAEVQLKYSQSCRSTWTWSLLWKLLFINWSRVTRVKLSANRTSHRHRSHCYSMRETTPPSWSTCKSPCCYVMTWLSRAEAYSRLAVDTFLTSSRTIRSWASLTSKCDLWRRASKCQKSRTCFTASLLRMRLTWGEMVRRSSPAQHSSLVASLKWLKSKLGNKATKGSRSRESFDKVKVWQSALSLLWPSLTRRRALLCSQQRFVTSCLRSPSKKAALRLNHVQPSLHQRRNSQLLRDQSARPSRRSINLSD